MDARQQVLSTWLQGDCGIQSLHLTPLAGDASFRRYFRFQHQGQSFIAMDAPPPREQCLPFVAIAKALAQMNLCVPEVKALQLEQGFLWLSDLGDELYLKVLNSHNAEALYQKALSALAVLQSCRHVEAWTIPPFTADFMRQELQLCKEWFLQRHLQLELSISDEVMLTDCFNFLAEQAASQPQVFMHRDYHSANLMNMSEQVGILDFQDAFMGPVTYDLVSLLRDCYIDWPDDFVLSLLFYYKRKLPQLASISDVEFVRMFDLMGLQRHLKALLTFSRKYHRDACANYLKYIPRTLNYIHAASQKYPECKAFNQFLQKNVLEKVTI